MKSLLPFLVLALVSVVVGCSQKPEATNQTTPDGSGPSAQPEARKAEVPKVSIQDGIEIESRVRQPEHVLDRFGFVKDLNQSDYVAWRIQAGGVFGQMVAEFDTSPDRHYVESLLLLTNKGDIDRRVDIANVFLEDGANQLLPWEALPGNAFDSYEELARYVGLSPSAPIEKTMITFNTAQDHKWRGAFYTTLKPGQKAWVDFIFLVPNTLHSAKLHFGPKPWNPIDVVL